jgi:hypothetical protein
VPGGITDGPSSFAVALSVSDGSQTTRRSWAVRVHNRPPRILSAPLALVREGEELRYLVEAEDAAGDRDPLTFSLIEGPPAALMEEALLSWTAERRAEGEEPVRVPIEIEVRDDDGGSARQRWELLVSPNQAPEPPALIYPVGGLPVATDSLRLAIGNAVDPEGDALIYRFELSAEEGFPAEETWASVEVEEEPGFTDWPAPTELTRGHYFWRAWAEDGVARSAAPVADFTFLGRVTGEDAGPPDAGSGPDAGVGGAPSGSCAVRPGRGAAFQAGMLCPILLLTAAWARRRLA